MIAHLVLLGLALALSPLPVLAQVLTMVETGRTGKSRPRRLRADGIAVRPCGSFPGLTDDHLRITARDADRNGSLARALAVALATLTADALETESA